MADGVSFKDKFERLSRRVENEEEKSEEMLKVGIDQVLTHVGAGVVAFAHGRKGGMPAIARLPVDALSAGVGNLIGWGLMFTGRMYGRHVVALSTGPSVWWFGGEMAKWGNKIRKEKGEMLNREPTTEEQEEMGIQYRTPIIAGDGGVRGGFVRQHANQGRY